jgi:hypothetical protein
MYVRSLFNLRSKMRSAVFEIPEDSGAFGIGYVSRGRRILPLLIG